MTTSPHRPNRGFHGVLAQRQPRLFIDGCVQIWPDADWATAHRHGVHVYAVTAFLPWVDLDEAVDALMAWHATARQHDNVRIISSTSDIEEVHADGSAGILLASQDGEFIGGSVGRIEAFYRLGLRMLILAYNRSNLLAGGCADNGNSGLSALGRRVVQECNRVGMLLDGSHMSERSTLEMIDLSTAPIVFSHANPREVVDNPRNISDAQIRACAERGGVIGVVPWGPIVYKPGTSRRPTVDDLIDCVDHIAQVTGSTDAVAIGTDFSLGTYGPHTLDPWGQPDYFHSITAAFDQVVPPGSLQPERFTEGFDTYPEILNVIDRLEARGYADSDVDGILGRNFLRVCGDVWK
jgi:membrane dipeptidase